MEDLAISLNLETEPWRDLAHHRPDHGRIIRVGLLPNATHQNRPALEEVIRLDDGRLIFAETTWALWRGAMIALNACPIARLDQQEHP